MNKIYTDNCQDEKKTMKNNKRPILEARDGALFMISSATIQTFPDFIKSARSISLKIRKASSAL